MSDNWIKALLSKLHAVWDYGEANLAFSDNYEGGQDWLEGKEEFTKELKRQISQVEKDAIEKTNKRWREKVEYLKNRKDRFNTEQMRRQEFGYNKALSDLLEDKYEV